VVVIMAYELYSILASFAKRYNTKYANKVGPLKRRLESIAFFLPACAFSVLLVSGIEPLRMLARQVIGALTLNDPISVDIWPNVFSTVGELSSPSFTMISKFTGGQAIFITCLFCMLILVLRNKHYRLAKRESIFSLLYGLQQYLPSAIKAHG